VAADLTLRAATFPTPLGPLTVVRSPDGIVTTGFGEPDVELEAAERRFGVAPVFDERSWASVANDVVLYFAGRRRSFRTKVDVANIGDGFALDVYRAAMRVPYATLCTYGDVAASAGRPRAWRAVGSALRRCPVELWVPCHRIVTAGPGFGRYGGHEDRRLALLRLEGVI
jgi:methylated-DNA-[protein]-cysteine S-methyltransferase